jgi:peptide/nickel transport system permease protein
MVGTLIGISVLIFTLSRVIPGDPIRLALGPEAKIEQVEMMRRTLGFDKPFYVQYYELVKNLCRGQVGIALNTRRDASLDVIEYAPATIELITVALVISVFLGIILGVIAALHQNTLVDHLSRVVVFGGISFPQFYSGILLQLLFAWSLSLLPFVGRIDGTPPNHITGFYLIDSLLAMDPRAFFNSLKHIILPATTLSMSMVAQVSRLIRANMVEELRKDYIVVAKILGMPKILLVYKYMLKNALSSTVTIIGLSFGFLLGNAFVVEVVFAWPGLASYGVRAMLFTDFNGMIAVTLAVGIAVVIVNFITDLIYVRLDPRIAIKR